MISSQQTQPTETEKFVKLAKLANRLYSELPRDTQELPEQLKKDIRKCAARFETVSGIYDMRFLDTSSERIPHKVVVGVHQKMTREQPLHLQDALNTAHFYNKQRLLFLSRHGKDIPPAWIQDSRRFLKAIRDAINEASPSQVESQATV